MCVWCESLPDILESQCPRICATGKHRTTIESAFENLCLAVRWADNSE